MSSTTLYVPSHHGEATRQWPIEDRRGLYAMYTVVATECSLFVCLFASYYYLGNDKNRWAIDRPPQLHFALILLALLLASSGVLRWGELQVARARYKSARVAISVTVAMGLVFLFLQVLEYQEHWKTLTPWSDSYGSIFYVITTFHAAHVLVGVLLLAYVALLPRYGPSITPPYRPYQTVAIYWHFVDLVWIFVVALLYVLPNLQVH